MDRSIEKNLLKFPKDISIRNARYSKILWFVYRNKLNSEKAPLISVKTF